MSENRPTVMLVDDSAATRTFFAQLAEKCTFDLHACAAADEATTLLDANVPDIIFLNVMMPGKDGYTFLREVRTRGALGATPVVIITSKDYAQDRAAARDLGVNEFLAKPVTGLEIKALVDKYCLQSAARD